MKEGETVPNVYRKDEMPQWLLPLAGSLHGSGLSAFRSEDIQAKFRALQDSYARVKLDPDMKLNGSKIGLKFGQKDVASVLLNCSKYAETGLKILTFINEKVGDPSYKVNSQFE